MSEEFTDFVKLCHDATSGFTSFDVVIRWLLDKQILCKDLLSSEGPIDFLLKLKAPIEVLRTLLHVAPILKYKRFSHKRVVLHLAACSSVSVEIMEYLLEVNFHAMIQQDSLGNLPVHCAVKHFAPYEVISSLMNHSRTPSGFTTVVNNSLQTLVHIACSSNPSVIDKIVGRFWDKEPLMMKDRNGNLPLHIACSNFLFSQLEPGSYMVRRFIRCYREALQIPNNDGNLPLHMACKTNQRKGTIQPLLDTKSLEYAFPDAAMVKNKDGKLPLHLACEVNANIFIIESLLSCYPEATLVQDNDGNLPIHLYCIHNHSTLRVKKVEKLLVNNPGTLCVQNHDRKFPSCYFDVASGEKYFTIAKEAIIKGLSVYLVQLLLMEFKDTSMIYKDSEGNTLLHLACMKSVAEVSIATIAYLVDYFPESCNSVNKDGKTPKDLLKPAASYKDKAGRLLLHRLLATRNAHWMYTVDLTESVIIFFADAYPNSITVPDNNDMLPFHHLCLSDWCMTNELFVLLRRYPDSLKSTPNMVGVVPESKKKKLN